MKVRYIGETFGGGYTGLTNGKVYECIGIEYDLLRIIDDEGEDYLYSSKAPGPLDKSSPTGKWEIVEDDDTGSLAQIVKTPGEEPET